MKYRSGYRFQLADDLEVQTSIKPTVYISTEFITLTTNGKLIIKRGYAWDGPSGPTIDTKSFMRGSAAHDAFYQLMRNEHLGIFWRVMADQLLRQLCIEDGMWRFRAWYIYQGLQLAHGDAAMPENRKKVHEAP